MSIVNFDQLRDIMQTSWNVLKNRVNEIYNDYVSKTRPNTISGETIITNGYVSGNSDITKIYKADGVNMEWTMPNDTAYFGVPSLNIPARTNVDSIIAIMTDGAGDIGATVTGINIGVVSIATGKVTEYVHKNARAQIIANPIASNGNNSLSGDKAIRILINKTWNEDVYFLIGAKGMALGQSPSSTPSVGGNTLIEEGSRVQNANPGNYIGKVAIYTSKYSLNEVAKKAISLDTEVRNIKSDYVSKTEENYIDSKTTIVNGRILKNAANILNNTGATDIIANHSNWCGSPNFGVDANVYVSCLAIAVNDSLAIGTEITNIKIGVVNRANNRVLERITTTGKAVVCQNIYGHINSSKIVLYPIQRSFDTNMYFVVGFQGMKWGRGNQGWQTVYPGNRAFPNVNDTLTINSTNYIPQGFILSEGTRLDEMLTSINSLNSSKANLSSANTFSNTNTFNNIVTLNKDVNVKYVSAIDQALLDGDSQNASGWEVYFDRNVYIPAGSYVSNLEIRVTSDVGTGTRLSNIFFYEVQRNANVSQDYIVERRSAGADVVVSENYGNVIKVTLNRTFNRDTYYMIGQKESSGKLLRANDSRGNIRYAISTNAFVMNPGNLGNRPVASNSKLVHRYIIERTGNLQNDMETVRDNIIQLNSLTIKTTDIGNEAGKIPRVGENGRLDPSILPPENNGGVRTVNNQSPNSNGDVTVLSEHIKYTNGQDTTVKQAIDGKPNSVNGQRPSASNGDITLLSEHIKYTSGANTTVKQAIDNKINTSDAVTTSTSGKIVKLDDNGKINLNMLQDVLATPEHIARRNASNTFTSQNTFVGHSPAVNRLFTRKHVNSNVTSSSNVTGFDINTYFLVLNEKYTDHNKQISHVLLPIKNAQVGDNISIQYFMFNNNNRIIYKQNWSTDCPVVDIEIAGCKCAKIAVNRSSGTEGVGFGFMVFTHSLDGRTLGAACVRNTSGNNIAWTNTYAPNESSNYSPNANITFPYKICYETTSEVVTRFELENVTQMYPRLIGEYRNLSYDAGDVLEEDGHRWLKANGQTLCEEEYPELYSKMNPTRSDEPVELPSVENQVGYYYIYAK